MILIVDGMNLFIRAFTVNPVMDANGEHRGGLLGFLTSLNKLIRENKPDRVLVVWEGEGGSVKRRSMFKDYKAGRKLKLNRQYDFEDPQKQVESFAVQLRMLDEFLEFLPVKTIKVKGLEADDVIAYVCNFILHNEKKLIVSSDKDFYQLLDKNTIIYSPTKKKYFTTTDLVKTLNIMPENFIIMKALVGDGSDNIGGVKGIGAKTVIKLFPFLNERPSTLHDVLDFCKENEDKNKKYSLVLESKEKLFNNVELMQLDDPLMNPLSGTAIRHNMGTWKDPYMPVKFRLLLQQKGLQLNASDFFVTFKEQSIRSKRG